MSELTSLMIRFTTLEKAMDLPEGAKIASVIQDPMSRVIHILIAYERAGEEITCTKLEDIGKGFWEFVPDHLRVQRKIDDQPLDGFQFDGT